MADLSQLGNLTASEPVDMSGLVPQGPRFPVKGRYTLRITEPPTFGATAAGNLSAEINPVIVGGPSDGYQVRYQKLSAKTYPDRKTGKPTSQVAQFLAACGVRGELSSDPQEAADAIEATVGATFEGLIDWETPFSSGLGIKGMESFTPDGNGGFLPWVETDEVDENGKKQRVRARAVVRYYNSKRG